MVKVLIKKISPEEGAGKKECSALLSAAGRRLLEAGVREYYGIRFDSPKEKEKELETARNRWGKPYLIRHPEIHFNISHSGRYAACAFGEEPLGLDIQSCGDAEFLKIAERYFSEEDQELLRNTRDLRRMFYRIWTREESYAKWLGTSLALCIGKTEKEGFCRWFEPDENMQGAVWTKKKAGIQVERL